MSYIDAHLDREHDRIYVVERDEQGRKHIVEHATNYLFYYPDPKGKYRSVFGDSLSRFSTRKRTEFQRELRIHSGERLFESDVNVVFRCLADNYLDKPAPKLHTAFFDIETDFDAERGFSPSDDPFNPVTAITVYLDWLSELVTLVIKPRHMSVATAKEITAEIPNCWLCDNETDMFNMFFDLIEDADVLSGWNSEGFDIPYLVNRVTRVMSKDDTRRFCLFGAFPKPRTYMRFGREESTYDLVGRIHMDYLQLYKKYNYEQRHSYKLDSIGEMEVGENKTQYEGTLDQLYNRDFKLFIEYNRQDTLLLFKIHNKLRFLDLANQLAHENTVLLPTVMGSVAMIEMAVINEAHNRGLIVQDKARREWQRDDDSDDSDSDEDLENRAAGAYVMVPRRGMHEWIGAVDINSLYPSTIRALNMAPETIVGQLRQTMTDEYMVRRMAELRKSKTGRGEVQVNGAQLWEGLFGSLEYTAVMNQERGTEITIDWEQGGSDTLSAAEVWRLIFDSNQPWMLTANGTIFTYEHEGVIPGLLSRWYSERKSIQAELKQTTDSQRQEFLDKRQLVRKILLNSAYGALLNEHCRFYDKRLGQSTTLNGRQIVKHMAAYLNQSMTGEYDHVGQAIIYGDTDSCYFSAWPIVQESVESGSTEWNKDTAVHIYDSLGEQVNASFPEFMERAFHCPRKNGEIIKAGRELVADRGIFITKKRYAVNIYDKEGRRLDRDGYRGKIKAMGLDLKRADTPKFIQDFLMQVLEETLAGADKNTVLAKIRDFKQQLSAKPAWEKGSPKSVNNLTNYARKLKSTSKQGKLFEGEFGAGKANMPGHVRAALNWNYLRDMNSDNYSMKIVDGMKIVVCKLKNNALNYTSIAYPTDELRLPEWFRELPFDDAEMENTLIDDKIENLLGVLGWDLRESLDVRSSFDSLFTIG